MKVCSLKRFLKYCLLLSFTSFITTIVFHFIHKPNHINTRAFDENVIFESVSRIPRSEKIDWHDEELIKKESLREGESYG